MPVLAREGSVLAESAHLLCCIRADRNAIILAGVGEDVKAIDDSLIDDSCGLLLLDTAGGVGSGEGGSLNLISLEG